MHKLAEQVIETVCVSSLAIPHKQEKSAYTEKKKSNDVIRNERKGIRKETHVRYERRGHLRIYVSTMSYFETNSMGRK